MVASTHDTSNTKSGQYRTVSCQKFLAKPWLALLNFKNFNFLSSEAVQMHDQRISSTEVSASAPSASGGPYASAVCIPIAQAYPVFKGMDEKVPTAYAEHIPSDFYGIMKSVNRYTIRQHVKVLPKGCFVCPPCAPQENTYSVYAGLDNQNTDHEILRVNEYSDDWNRCCCKPYHPIRLEVKQYIPLPGDINVSSTFDHLRDDVRRDFERINVNWGTSRVSRMREMTNRHLAERRFYENQPVLYSLVRDDGQRCCYKCPCKWLDTFVCFDCCRDGAHIYSGPVQDLPNEEIGRNKNLPQTNLIGSVNQPLWGGCCIPTLHLRDNNNDSSEPFAKVEGPCCFGGWAEMCFSFKFWVSSFNSASKSGDVALITKRKPGNLSAAAVELCSDADVYTIQFNESANLTVPQKIIVLTAQLMADYMFFDGQTEKCQDKGGAIWCYCFYCSCIGAILPCALVIPKQ